MLDSDEIDNLELVEKAAKFQKVVTEKGTGLIISYSPCMDYEMFVILRESVLKWAKKFGVEEEDVLYLPDIIQAKIVTRIAQGVKLK